VYDTVDYLASLGKSQTAAVKRDAEIGVAQVIYYILYSICPLCTGTVQDNRLMLYSITTNEKTSLQANRDAGIREAECERKAMDVKYSTGERANTFTEAGTGSQPHWGMCLAQVRCLCGWLRWDEYVVGSGEMFMWLAQVG
jgi:hypothetical protein